MKRARDPLRHRWWLGPLWLLGALAGGIAAWAATGALFGPAAMLWTTWLWLCIAPLSATLYGMERENWRHYRAERDHERRTRAAEREQDAARRALDRDRYALQRRLDWQREQMQHGVWPLRERDNTR